MERHATDLDTAIATLQNGIIATTPSAAISMIDRWQHHLEQSGRADLQQIAVDLDELKRLFVSGNLNGRLIGQILERLGSQTTTVANTAEPQVQARLQQLGQLLSRAGQALR